MGGVEFGGDVVQKQNGLFAASVAGDGVLSELEGEGGKAKLATGADVGEGAAVQPGFQVVAVWAEAGGASLDVAVASLVECDSVALGVETEARGAIGQIKPRAALHGFESQIDGSAHAGDVGGSGAGDRDGGLGDAVVPEFELGWATEAALETTQQGRCGG